MMVMALLLPMMMMPNLQKNCLQRALKKVMFLGTLHFILVFCV